MSRYRAAIAAGTLAPDPAQAAAADALEALAQDLGPRHFSLFNRRGPAKGVYLWGDVGRGKTLLMDMFFEDAPDPRKLRRHFNAFMVDVHARIHAARGRGVADPIPVVAREIADGARLFCFDEFQVTDVADAMILGRLFEQFFEAGIAMVATSNTPPDRLYEGGLNRQLFLPFIAEIKARMTVVTVNGATDYRRRDLLAAPVYATPLGPAADAAMDAAWAKLTGGTDATMTLTAQGRAVAVPRAGRGAARFFFDELCARPLGQGDYLAIAQAFHTVLIDHIPMLTADLRNEARRFTLLVDTLYDDGIALVCSAAAPPDQLYAEGPGAEAFRRTASRLVEMQSEAYLSRYRREAK